MSGQQNAGTEEEAIFKSFQEFGLSFSFPAHDEKSGGFHKDAENSPSMCEKSSFSAKICENKWFLENENQDEISQILLQLSYYYKTFQFDKVTELFSKHQLSTASIPEKLKRELYELQSRSNYHCGNHEQALFYISLIFDMQHSSLSDYSLYQLYADVLLAKYVAGTHLGSHAPP
eukprot:Sdes_comp18706_c0_seq2m9020